MNNTVDHNHHQRHHHEVVYFPVAGRAEPIRICLHIAHAKWKDTRIQGNDWPTLKPTTPLGSLPVLTISEAKKETESELESTTVATTTTTTTTTLPSTFTHCQSMALDRYAAKLAGMYPVDDDPPPSLVRG